MAAVESYSIFSATQPTALLLDGQAFTVTAVTQSTPVMRGENVIPAMDHGLRWREKRMGGRQETWEMWISGEYNSAGAPLPAVGAKEAQFNANWETLMGALTTTKKADGFDAPLKVMRTMKSTPSSPANVYRLNYGEVNGPISAEDHGTWNHTRFSVPILYVDPRWYECTSAGVKTAATPITATGQNPGGTALMTDMTITLTTGGAGRYIENTTTGSRLEFSGTPSGTIVFNTKNYTVTDSGTNAIGSLTRSGSSTTDWFQLLPGVNNAISSNSAFSIAYTKAYV
jgi:hypothetical protein